MLTTKTRKAFEDISEIKEMKVENGWLTPDGEYIPCEPYKHDKIARKHGGSEPQWERLGYVKVFNGRWYCEHFLTDAQEKWLTDNNCL